MNYGPVVFLISFLALSASWFGFILKPQFQIGNAQPETNIVNTAGLLYPQNRPGEARQGAAVYRAEGCVYCHSQQVGQTGIRVDVMLAEPGSNTMAVAELLNQKFNVKISGPALGAGLPKAVLRGVEIDAANAAVKALQGAGAKAEARIVPVGPDIARGWGTRRTVAADYIYDTPAMLGSQRIGPDLANVGLRWPEKWELLHLYAPQAEVKDSPMPPFRFLFAQKKIERQPSPEALELPKEFAPPAGYEIVPKPEAKELVAYLLSLRAETPLFEAPASAVGAMVTNTAAK